MGIPNTFSLVQLCLYSVTFIVSFLVCVPAGVNVSSFNGHCLLDASGVWIVETSGPHISEVKWGSDSACNSIIFIGVVSMMLSLFYFLWTGYLLANTFVSSWLDAFVNLIVTIVMAIFMFSNALVVSIGFQQWCRFLLDPKGGVDRCEDAQYESLFKDMSITSDSYHTQWQVVQFAVWLSWIIWLVLSIMAMVKMYELHRQENFGVSVNRERERLLQKVAQRTAQPC